MERRAYLRPHERRHQLLDAASRLFDRGGFSAITISAVAAEAGASRRLVYDHFADLADLIAAFFDDRVARYARAIDVASDPLEPGGPRSLGGAVRQLLEVPAEDLLAIHLLIVDRSTPELAGARAALRDHLQARWLPALGSLGFPLDVAEAALWTLASSLVTLAVLVQRDELDASAAHALGLAMAASLPSALVPRNPDPSPASEIP